MTHYRNGRTECEKLRLSSGTCMCYLAMVRAVVSVLASYGDGEGVI